MTLRLKLAHKKHEIQVAIPPQEAAKETFGDLKVRGHFLSTAKPECLPHITSCCSGRAWRRATTAFSVKSRSRCMDMLADSPSPGLASGRTIPDILRCLS